MNRILLYALFLVLPGCFLNGQNVVSEKPKLVVGIVVDQMRFDQLYRYEKKYSAGGFMRLMREGYNFKNANYNYVPTVTAAGHASIYTGTTPSEHGIIGNSWYDRYAAKLMGNVDDANETIVGSVEKNALGASPKNLMTTTISDQLRLATNFKAKVISVSLKDRGAILPGGHTANAAYWHDWVTSPGYFVSSTYYMDELPKWVNAFNKLEKSNAFLNNTWNTLYPIETYTESEADNNNYEPSLGGKPSPTFPYDLKSMREKYKSVGAEYQLIWVTPAGNSLLTEFALAAVKNEELGKDDITDLLSISYTVPDIMGHTFGPQSVEIEDVYLRLDKDIERLLNSLDNTVGANNYVLFLTSDHAAMPVASFLKDHKLPAGVARIQQYQDAVTNFLNSKYGSNSWIENFDGEQLYLNRSLITNLKLDLNTIEQEVADFLIDIPGIHNVLTAHDLQTRNYDNGIRQLVQNGYYAKRSGDVLLSFDSGFTQNPNSNIDVSQIKGTTHGSGYAYDTHVPLLWFGSGIPKGESVRKVAPIDIAPSLAMIFNINLPSGTSGEPLVEIFKDHAH
jgi:predicted AlkP superfamily pyrophosphatase or phosphodiesterase